MRTSLSFKSNRLGRTVYLISLSLLVLGACLLRTSTSLSKNLAVVYTPPASNRVDGNINSAWKFIRQDVAGAQNTGFDDSAWSGISLPHTWNNMDGQDGGNNYYRGIGWYRKHYTVPAGYAGRRLFLQFDGAN